jgi:tRNA G18 (ribose-2'-O)-methylase SpoU
MFDIDLRGPVAIFVGGEGRGLAPAVIDNTDLRVTIPMRPPVESLNTAVTAALLVYEARRQRLEAPGPAGF